MAVKCSKLNDAVVGPGTWGWGETRNVKSKQTLLFISFTKLRGIFPLVPLNLILSSTKLTDFEVDTLPFFLAARQP